jgi:DNA invertase Pin-like site-specific DNA recombinase
LHSVGLLAAAFRPDEKTCQLRAYLRQRANVIRQASQHPVTVEYDTANGRASKTFADAYAGRRFYCAKDKAGKNPRVVAATEYSGSTSELTTGASTRPAIELATPRLNSRASHGCKATSRTKAIAAYIRVSTVGQNEAGQRAEIERWLTGNGINPTTVRWYLDKGKSGDNLKRPAFGDLQSAIFAGKIGTIVTYKLDRLSRSLRDGINVLCEWCDKGLRVVSVTQQIDFNGTVGKMLAAVLLGIAEMEQETRRERQAAGIAVAKKAGKYRGRKRGTTKAKPERAYMLRDSGLSADEIARSLGVSRNTVFVYLRKANV